MALTEKKTVAVGISGGIDSAVSVWLLKEQGYHVIGLTMSIWDPRMKLASVRQGGCYGPGEVEDIAAAREIAERLHIPHHTLALADAYERCVLKPFRSQYLAGYTPNPCAYCNPEMKFGVLPEQARASGLSFDFFATGHYARIVPAEEKGRVCLLRGVDRKKDQSYFLARLNQTQLSGILFPLGDKTKDEVREIARTVGLGLLTEKKESQDFFEGDDIAVLFNGDGTVPGPIMDEEGRVLGQHRGIIHYTVGQRDGLGIAVGHKVYVKTICAESNTLVVAPREGVFAGGCQVSDLHWIAGTPPDPAREITVQLRYRHPGVTSQLRLLADHTIELDFAKPQFAVTPGQMAVLYHGEEVLGGGWITRGRSN